MSITCSKRARKEKIFMNNVQKLSGPEYGPLSGSKVEQLIIMCHGLGADGNDLIGLAPYFSRVLPNAKFVSPNAPFECDMAPSGFQWFSLIDRSEESTLEGARIAQPIINNFIDQQLEEYSLTEKDLALIGFSQGTMISIFSAPRRNKQIAGIIGYSGRLVGPHVLAKEINCKPPIVMINGDRDELVPHEAQINAIEKLIDVGIVAEGHIIEGLGHSIDEQGLTIGQDFLKTIFKLHAT